MKKKYLYTILIGCSCFLATSLAGYSQNLGSEPTDKVNPTDNAGIEQDQQDDKDNKSAEGMGSMNTGTVSSESIPLDLHSVMRNNMNEMMSMKMTGQMDSDFAKMMAHHHRGGVKMSQVYLQSGQDNKLKEMATKLVSEQNIEIEKLEAFKGSLNDKSKNEAASAELLAPMEKMMEKNHESQLAGGIDKEFASLMLEHHRAGVEMAEVEIKSGKNTEMKAMAKKIKAQQSQEIETLENWLSATK